MNSNHSSLTFTAIQAALSAGELLRKGFGSIFEIGSKEGHQNLVTEYDKRSESQIIGMISKVFPHHDFLAEESCPSTTAKREVLWIIDPLDGTVNFAHQIPIFSISIAAAIGNEIVSGVVYQPMTQELFIAEKGKGAYLNGNRLSVSKKTSLHESLLATGFPYNVDTNPLHCIDRFAHITQLGIPIRRLGSAAIDLSYVAAGRFGAYWEVSLHPWDMAAGKLLVEEAGGMVSHYDGTPHKIFCQETLVASNGLLHKAILKEINL